MTANTAMLSNIDFLFFTKTLPGADSQKLWLHWHCAHAIFSASHFNPNPKFADWRGSPFLL